MPKRRFASSILLLNRGDSWTGLDLEYGNVTTGPDYYAAFLGIRELVQSALQSGAPPAAQDVGWIYAAMYRLAMRHGRPCPVDEPRNALATHLAIPVLFSHEGEPRGWAPRSQVAYALKTTQALPV
jgi:hypothetical protein